MLSPNGKLMCEMAEDQDLSICNFNPDTQGKWTRIQHMANGTTNKSTIDYVALQKEDTSLMSEMTIDEDKIYCPYRERNTRKQKKIIFSDHCAIVFSTAVNDTPVVKRKAWNFTKDGYTKYATESTQPMEVVWSSNITETYGNWVSKFEGLLHTCFTKKTIKQGQSSTPVRHKGVRDILIRVAKRGKIQRRVVTVYLQRMIEIEVRQQAKSKAERLKHTMSNLTEDDKFSPNAYWKLKQAADKKLVEETVYSVKKENGVEITGEKGIMDAYREEFQYRLRTREPPEEWKQYVEETNKTIREWLSSDAESSPPFTREELDKAIGKLRNGKKSGMDGYPPELFIHAGEGTRASILKLFNDIKACRQIPEQWNVMMIVTIYKKKGCKKMLRYYRGIFLAIVISKLFESVIKTRIDHNLNKINLLQAGSRSNRGTPDNVFLLRGCVDHYVAIKRPLYITAYDYEQAFDSLWVEKCILALRNLGVTKEMLQLIYNLNKEAKVVIKTPFGLTSPFETEPIVKQGTVLGSALCSSSTAEYCGTNEGVPVGDMMLSSLLYVDDLIDLTTSEMDRLEAHRAAILFSKMNNLTLSGTKCYGLAMNCEIQPPTLTIDELKEVIPAEMIVYLGDPFNHKGNNDDLIQDRVKRGTKAMNCITSLIHEVSLGIHQISVWMLLYRSLFISTVLFNSQSWSKLRQKDMETLKSLQLRILKKMISVPASTPNSFIFLEMGVLPIAAEIHKRMLMYLHRILQLPSNDPVSQMFMNLKALDEEKGKKNWWTLTKTLLPKYNLNTLNLESIKSIKKCTFKKIVNNAVNDITFEDLKKECGSLKKTAGLSYSSFSMQEYLTKLYPSQARLIFKARCQSLDIKTQSTYKNGGDIVCRKCGTEEETLSHALNCGYDKSDHINTDIKQLGDMSPLLLSALTRIVIRIDSFCDHDNTNTQTSKRKSLLGPTCVTQGVNKKLSCDPSNGVDATVVVE